MADKRVFIAQSSLFGPAGNSSTDKRVLIAQSQLTGPIDKRVFIAQSVLEAPPPDKRVMIAQSQLVGPSSPPHRVYIGTADGWKPARVLVVINGVWTEI